MTPQAAQAMYGATHYTAMRDGVTPQMYYKTSEIPFSDGTSHTCWVYLSYANIWMGSGITEEQEHLLIPIT